MPSETPSFGISSKKILDARASARDLGISPEVFISWVRRRLIPGPIEGGWTRDALTEALDRLAPKDILLQKKK